MKLDIQQIAEGENSVTIRYRKMTPTLHRVIGILEHDDDKLWGRIEEERTCIPLDEVLYLETVDEKVFAYSDENVLRIDGSLQSFQEEADERFFRCSKSMVLNVNRVKSLKSLSSNRIDATMENGEHIIISRRYASEFRRLLKGGR